MTELHRAGSVRPADTAWKH